MDPGKPSDPHQLLSNDPVLGVENVPHLLELVLDVLLPEVYLQLGIRKWVVLLYPGLSGYSSGLLGADDPL